MRKTLPKHVLITPCEEALLLQEQKETARQAKIPGLTTAAKALTVHRIADGPQVQKAEHLSQTTEVIVQETTSAPQSVVRVLLKNPSDIILQTMPSHALVVSIAVRQLHAAGVTAMITTELDA